MKEFKSLLKKRIVLIIIVILCVGLLHSACVSQKEESVSFPGKKTAIKYEKVVVIDCIDGDTVVVQFNDGRERKVRLIGVDSPEAKKEPFWKEAFKFTEAILLGKEVYIEKDVRETDKYGRLLRYIWLNLPLEIKEDEIKSKLFNAILVLKGYAKAVKYPPDVKYFQYLKEFQEKAEKEKRGMWNIRSP